MGKALPEQIVYGIFIVLILFLIWSPIVRVECEPTGRAYPQKPRGKITKEWLNIIARYDVQPNYTA